MTVPALTLYSQGQGVFNADWGNTAVQGGTLLADLRDFTGQAKMTIVMLGYTAPNDGGQGLFYWATGTGYVDDGGVTTIVPTGQTGGAWLRLNLS